MIPTRSATKKPSTLQSRRPSAVAIPLTDDDFVTGGLPRASYVNPWTIATFRHADMQGKEGQLVEETTETIAWKAAGYLGVQ